MLSIYLEGFLCVFSGPPQTVPAPQPVAVGAQGIPMQPMDGMLLSHNPLIHSISYFESN